MRLTSRNIFALVILALAGLVVARPGFAQNVSKQVLGTLSSRIQETTYNPFNGELFSFFQKSPSKTNPEEGKFGVQTIIDATNKERIAAGLPPLTLNAKLNASAKMKTDDMIARQYFEHESPTGEEVSDLGARVGYDYVIMGENLARGDFKDGDDLLQAWMESPGHRANILSTKYEEIGVYAVEATYEGQEVWFAVQHFGTPRTACPSVNTALRKKIDAINKDLEQRQKLIATDKMILESPDRPRGEEYRAMVTSFNELVGEYNTILFDSRQKIRQYNAQVSAFNSCIVKYQEHS